METKAIIYVIETFILVLLLYIFYRISGRKNKFNIFDIFLILFLIIFTGIRYYVGSDYGSYLSSYKIFLLMDYDFVDLFNMPGTFGQNLCMFIGKMIFGNNVYGVFWVFSIFIYPLLIYTIRKQSVNPSESFLLYCLLGYFAMSMNILKQITAMTIILFSVHFLHEKKYIRFIIFSGIACLFHISTIIIIPLIILANTLKTTRKLVILSIIFSIIAYIGYMFIPEFLKLFPPLYDRFILYFNGTYTYNIYGRIGGLIYFIFHIIMTIFIMKYRKELIQFDKRNSLYINLLIISLPICAVSLQIRPINRLAFYLNQFLIFLLPSLIQCLSGSKKKKIARILYSIIFIYFIVYTVFSRDNIYYQYKTYL